MVYGASSGQVYQGHLDDETRITALFTKGDADAWIKKVEKHFEEPLIAVECKVVHQDIFFVTVMKNLKYTKVEEAMQFNGAN